MADHPKDDPTNYPLLGQRIHWISKPGSIFKIVTLLAIACVLVTVADFFYQKHGHFAEEHVTGFFSMFGFVAFTMVILCARGLRVLVGTREDYYGNKAVDQEDSYPADQIDIKDNSDV